MKKKLGAMNIPFNEHYDEEDDIYYVTFKTGEPSYCIEIDDILILEVGMFSGLPTGFRILNYTKNDVGAVGIFKMVKKTIDQIDRPSLGDREKRLKAALQSVSEK